MSGAKHGSSLTSNAVIMLGWQSLRAIAQGAWGLGLAHTLDAGMYGMFSGLAGLAATVGALTGVGYGLLMLRRVSMDPLALGQYWTKALVFSLLTGAALVAAYLALAPSIVGQSIRIEKLVAVAISEIIFLPVLIISSYAFQTHERMSWAGAMYTLGPLGNLAALGAYVVLHEDEPDLLSYLTLHACTAAAMAVTAAFAVGLVLRPKSVWPRVDNVELREASGLTLMRVSDIAFAGLDKTLLLRLAGSAAAGNYTVACRIAALAAMPVVSLSISIAPRIFRAGRVSSGILKYLLTKTLAAGVIGCALVLFASFVLPIVLGSSFLDARQVLLVFVPLPALLGFTALASSLLLALGGHVTRMMAQSSAVLILSLLMTLLVRDGGGAAGGAAALMFAQAFLALMLWGAVYRTRQLPDGR